MFYFKIYQQTCKANTTDLSRLLADILRGLARSNEETRKQGLDIVSAIAKQPLLPELIDELNNYPGLDKKK